MFRKSLSKDSLQSTLNVSPVRELITELTEHNEESLQGGATSDFSLSNGGTTFWGVRTSGGILTVRWNPSSGKLSVKYKWV
ncbi:hypothetical protein [Allocoleopsis sp.]|uniref:hypothetical protein n=1 Tax=Allocoleopsis sp. TaxID=3088169 RepID=UPI002FD05CA3